MAVYFKVLILFIIILAFAMFQVHASTIYQNITQSLYFISKKTEVESIAEKIATGISLLMSAVRLHSNDTTSGHTAQVKTVFPLQSFCPRGRSEHVSTFAIGV